MWPRKKSVTQRNASPRPRGLRNGNTIEQGMSEPPERVVAVDRSRGVAPQERGKVNSSPNWSHTVS